MQNQDEIFELLRGIEQRDTLSENKFVRNYREIVFALAVHYVRTVEDAEEITNETLRICINLIRARKLRKPESLSSYILGVCQRQCLKHLRKTSAKKRGGKAIHYSLDDELKERSIRREISRMHEQEDPLEKLLSREKMETIKMAIKKIGNKRYRLVLQRVLHGYSQEEIATTLDISLQQLYSISYRARIALGKVLTDNDGKSKKSRPN